MEASDAKLLKALAVENVALLWDEGERLDNDPSGARYGCFLPDLTGLARCLPAPTSRLCS